jgi:hypothetical protein
MAPALGPPSGGEGSSSSASTLDVPSASHVAGGSDSVAAPSSSAAHFDGPKQCTHCGAALEVELDEPMSSESGAAHHGDASGAAAPLAAPAVPPEQPSPSARVFAPPPRSPDPAVAHAPLAAQLCIDCRARRDLNRLFAPHVPEAARQLADFMETDAPEREALVSPPWARWTSAPLNAPASRSRHVSPSRAFDAATASISAAADEQHLDVVARHSSPAAAPLLSQRSLSSQSRGSSSGGMASGSSSHAAAAAPSIVPTATRWPSSRARGASFSRSSAPHTPAAAPARGEALAVNLPRSARTSSSSSSSSVTGEHGRERRPANETSAQPAASTSAFGPHLLSRPRLSSVSAAEAAAPLHLPLYAALQQRRAAPDPRADISLLRYRTQGKGCLVPGATFTGTQKSGRSSYEVGVQIVVSQRCPQGWRGMGRDLGRRAKRLRLSCESVGSKSLRRAKRARAVAPMIRGLLLRHVVLVPLAHDADSAMRLTPECRPGLFAPLRLPQHPRPHRGLAGADDVLRR